MILLTILAVVLLLTFFVSFGQALIVAKDGYDDKVSGSHLNNTRPAWSPFHWAYLFGRLLAPSARAEARRQKRRQRRERRRG